ncbi:MAG TPA: glutamate cyclase domain-containing protein [Planctomycetaceae bacterium]|nr:glutamate cyclase domain-containing protein [Planctomycetaceae bacterium]
MAPSLALIDQIEALVRRDPAGRGLISSESRLGPLCSGHLAQAAQSLASTARSVVIVTGFFVPDADLPSAETDGPPGAVMLASALESVGIRCTLVTDLPCASAVWAAARATAIPPTAIEICTQPTEWFDDFVNSDRGSQLTHLIAVERVGPSHDEQSLARQSRNGPAPLAEFRAAVPVEHRDRCHNMRGKLIDDSTAPLHLLYEHGPRQLPDLKTIGIGDGGNEIGMGCVPWEDLARRIGGETSAWIPCRIATDWNVIAGTSNWGAFALAAATLLLMNRVQALAPLDEDFQRRLLEQMVVEGPAIDGMTRRREATVDGLPFATYIQSWLGIRRLLGL